MKLLFVVMDGLGDRPISEFGGQTPLEYAKTPNMDKLASYGMNGLLHVIGPGVTPGSDTAHLALFGVDPYEYYTGRGPFEAAGIGLVVKEGDIAFRTNFATINSEGVITDRRAGRIREGTDQLAKLFEGLEIDGIEILLEAGTEHRAALILRGDGLSDQVSENDPHVERKEPLEFKPLDESPEAEKTARVLTSFVMKARTILNNAELNKKRVEEDLLPANYLLIRGAGKVPKLPNFEEEYCLETACIAGGGLYKGVGRMLGMHIIEDSRMSGGTTTDLSTKFEITHNALNDYDFVFTHVKGTDNYSHDGKYKEKSEFIERVDKELYRFLPENYEGDLVIMITGDHSTPCSFKDHSADPVPILIYSPDCRRDKVEKFGESYAVDGSLGHILGKHIMGIALNEMRLVRKFGA
ncbi:MAG: 2,3-bisphosphoglycerate-independent phosphoglycerate mutase [Candidatus Heimdallarchaeota archaeon]|nr:2,3-bisphosphoglycerate-independent phosphoglycerate mutase [Candidatus Heimdallarchaeota archaeon]MCK5142726.1 2,3-bisphosphoglycerate-independent phosphoglycerate mutase [Candidatus Heimdallarchaeota archaeon]